jgi:SAM-dependent methyltransferase
MSTGISATQMTLEGNEGVLSPFETTAAVEINKRRKEFLDQFLPQLMRSHGLRTALDVGCGFGYFSQYLADLGLRVQGFDVRPENVEAAGKRCVGINFRQASVEDINPGDFGLHDLVFCAGLLYHLENPFRALRNLEAVTGQILLIETVIAPFRSQVTVLYEEERAENQGVNFVADIPSEMWFIKALYKVGFPFVYRASRLPDHRDFHSTFFRRRRRTVLAAAKAELQTPFLHQLAEPPPTNRHLWDPGGLSLVLRNERLRSMLKC